VISARDTSERAPRVSNLQQATPEMLVDPTLFRGALSLL